MKRNLFDVGVIISYYGRQQKQKFIPVEGLLYDEDGKILVFGKDYDETKYNLGTENNNEFMISRNVMFMGQDRNINEFGDFSYHELVYAKSEKKRCELTVDMIWDAEIEDEENKKRIFTKNGILWEKTEPDYGLDIKGGKAETRILYKGLLVLKERTKGVDDFGLRGNDFDGDIVLDSGCFGNAEFGKLNFYENEKFNMTPDIFALNGNKSIKEITWNEEFVSMQDTEDCFSRLEEIMETLIKSRKLDITVNIISNMNNYKEMNFKRLKSMTKKYIEPMAGKTEILWEMGTVSGKDNKLQ